MKSLLFPCMCLFVVCSCSSFENTAIYEHLDNEFAPSTHTALEGIDNLARELINSELKLQDYIDLPGVGLRIALEGEDVKVAEVDLAVGRLLATRRFQDGIYHSSVTYGAFSAGANSRGERSSEFTSDLISVKLIPNEDGGYFYNVKLNISIIAFQIISNESLLHSLFLESNFGPLSLYWYDYFYNYNFGSYGFRGNTGFKGFNFYVNPDEIDRFDFSELNGQVQIHFTNSQSENDLNGTIWLGPIGANIEFMSGEIYVLLDFKYVKASIRSLQRPYPSFAVQILNVFGSLEFDMSSHYIVRVRSNYFSYEYHQKSKFSAVTAWFSFRGHGFNFRLTSDNLRELKVVLNDKYSVIPLPHLDDIEGIGF